MTKVRIWAELSDERLRDYQSEAERQGVEVESLIEQTVSALLREMEEEQRQGGDTPVTVT